MKKEPTDPKWHHTDGYICPACLSPNGWHRKNCGAYAHERFVLANLAGSIEATKEHCPEAALGLDCLVRLMAQVFPCLDSDQWVEMFDARDDAPAPVESATALERRKGYHWHEDEGAFVVGESLDGRRWLTGTLTSMFGEPAVGTSSGHPKTQVRAWWVL